MIDQRFIVEYLCKSKGGKESCRADILSDIAESLEISGAHDMTLEQLCESINKKIVELDIIKNLAQCKQNVATLRIKSLSLDDPRELEADHAELVKWYDNIYTQATSTIDSGKLNKMVEIRNQ